MVRGTGCINQLEEAERFPSGTLQAAGKVPFAVTVSSQGIDLANRVDRFWKLSITAQNLMRMRSVIAIELLAH